MRKYVGVSVFSFCILHSAFCIAQEKTTYNDHVLPIFRNACLSCHNPEKKKAGLDLSTYQGAVTGSDNGKVFEPGDPDGSLLFRVCSRTEEPYMPPKGDKLPDKDLATLKKFIEGGLLETSSSSALVSNKPKVDLKVTVSAGKPDGPPPMPGPLVLEPVLKAQRPGAVLALGASPWSPLVAVGAPRQVLLYNTQTLDLLGILPFPEGEPYVLKFSRSGKLVMAGGGVGAKTGKVVLYDISNGSRVTEVGDEFDAVLAADLTPDQAHVAMGGPTRLVKIYNTASGAAVKTIKKHTDWITAVGYSPDGVLLSTGDRAGGLFVWEAATAGEFYNLDGHKAAITSVSFRGDSNVLASSSEDGNVILWDMNNGNKIREFKPAGADGVTSVHFTHDGRLVTSNRDGGVRVFAADGKPLKQMQPKFTDLALAAVFDGTGDRVVGGDWTGKIRVWTAADGVAQGELTSLPPSLADRIVDAQKRSAELQPAADKALAAAKDAQQAAEKAAADAKAAAENVGKTKAAFDAAQAAANAANAALDAALKEQKQAGEALPPTQQAVAQKTEAMNAAQRDLDAAAAQQKQAQDAIAAKQAAADAAKKSAAGAAEVAAKAPADAGLAKAAADAKALDAKQAEELAAAQKDAAAKTDVVKAMTEKRDKAKADVAAADEAFNKAKALADAREAARKAAVERQQAANAALPAARAAMEAAPKQVEPTNKTAAEAATHAAKMKVEADKAVFAVALARHEEGRFKAAQVYAVLYAAQQELAALTSARDNGPALIEAAQKAAEAARQNVAKFEQAIADAPKRLTDMEQRLAEARDLVGPALRAAHVADSLVSQREAQFQPLTEQAMKSAAAADKEKDKADLKQAAEKDKATRDAFAAEVAQAKAAAAAAAESYKAAAAEVAAVEIAIAREKMEQPNFPKKLDLLKQMAATAAADVPKAQQQAAEAPGKAAAAQAKVDQLKADYEKLLKQVPPPPAAVATAAAAPAK
jgi:WD40 repeat protein